MTPHLRGRQRRWLAFVVYPGVTPLDLVGPLTVLRNLGGTPYRTVVVGQRPEAMRTDTPLRLVPAATFADVPEPFAVVVPGGGDSTVAAMQDEALLGYLRSAAATAKVLAAVDNGALLLGAAGLLQGRRVAAHWAYRDLVESLGATWTPERWVVDGPVHTCAGGSAGIDLMLDLLARLKSRSSAQLAQLFMEYDPEPPFGRLDPGGADADLATRLRSPRSQSRPEQASQGIIEGRPERTIALVLYPWMTVLDLVGPLQVLSVLQRFAPEYRIVVVGVQIRPMDTDVHVRMIPDSSFADVPRPYAIVVPGGRGATLRAMSDPAMREYVRTATASADIVTSVCTGALILAALDLLEGREATTNWFFAGVLKPLGATYRRKRWVDDDNLITGAGVSAGIDMALHLAARLTDDNTARQVQLGIDYDPRPPFGGIDWGQIPALPRAMRRAITLSSPAIAARPKRLLRAGR